MLIKTIAGIVLFAAVGAAIGYSQILCASGGQCAITGTPYGGALFGGMLGMAVMSSLGNKPIQSAPTHDDDDQSADEPAPRD